MTLETMRITTRRGIEGDVLVGGTGPDIVFFHGAGGTMAQDPLLNTLAQSFTVHAPIWPGYGADETETAIEDMLDFALHGWDLVDALEPLLPPSWVAGLWGPGWDWLGSAGALTGLAVSAAIVAWPGFARRRRGCR